MAQNNKLKTLKRLETASMWCAISSLLVFFVNMIALIALLVVEIKDNQWPEFQVKTYYLTLITEIISMVCIVAWMVMAIIEMAIITRHKELDKYRGSFASWIVAMILSIGFMFLSLFIFVAFVETFQQIVYITFALYLAATIGSTIYIVSVSRSLKKIRNAQ